MFAKRLGYSFVKKHGMSSSGNLNDAWREREAWLSPCLSYTWFLPFHLSHCSPMVDYPTVCSHVVWTLAASAGAHGPASDMIRE